MEFERLEQRSEDLARELSYWRSLAPLRNPPPVFCGRGAAAASKVATASPVPQGPTSSAGESAAAEETPVTRSMTLEMANVRYEVLLQTWPSSGRASASACASPGRGSVEPPTLEASPPRRPSGGLGGPCLLRRQAPLEKAAPFAAAAPPLPTFGTNSPAPLARPTSGSRLSVACAGSHRGDCRGSSLNSAVADTVGLPTDARKSKGCNDGGIESFVAASPCSRLARGGGASYSSTCAQAASVDDGFSLTALGRRSSLRELGRDGNNEAAIVADGLRDRIGGDALGATSPACSSRAGSGADGCGIEPPIADCCCTAGGCSSSAAPPGVARSASAPCLGVVGGGGDREARSLVSRPRGRSVSEGCMGARASGTASAGGAGRGPRRASPQGQQRPPPAAARSPEGTAGPAATRCASCWERLAWALLHRRRLGRRSPGLRGGGPPPQEPRRCGIAEL